MSSRHQKRSKKDELEADSSKVQFDVISEEDYFKKNAEFRVWLLDSKGKYFDEMDKSKQRKYFEKFVSKWNEGRLKDKFYQGIRSSQIPRNDTTRHQWKFAKKLNHDEMDSIKSLVDTATNPKSSKTSIPQGSRTIGPSLPPASSFERQVDEVDARYDRYKQKKGEDKLYRKRKEADLEELVPKETGREAMLQNRREKASYTKRERSPDVELNDSELLGGDDFQTALARQKARDAQRNERRNNIQREKAIEMEGKVSQYRAKEDATMEMFRQMAARHNNQRQS